MIAFAPYFPDQDACFLLMMGRNAFADLQVDRGLVPHRPIGAQTYPEPRGLMEIWLQSRV